ncbi:MAG: hypothetical protein EON59_08785 [Alphaproteobacteria bacterium]|nr:MAG: hypothetical protein EON59_08785 [Alphaproteobacteria bacterium]
MADNGKKTYRLVVNGQPFETSDQIEEGRDILQLAGFVPASDHTLIELTRPGSRSVGLDEEVDLGEPGREEFRAFASDRTFNFTVDERGYEWGSPEISEADLRDISGAPDNRALVLERTDEPDVEIELGSTVDLATRGTERIRSSDKYVTIIVEAEPHRWPKGEKITYAQVVTLAFPDFPQHPERTYSVTYRNGVGQNHEGVLAPGASVKVKEGMVFNVTDTGQS